MITDYEKELWRVQVEAVVTEREGMKAENTNREQRGESMAYGEDAFGVLVAELARIEEQIRNS